MALVLSLFHLVVLSSTLLHSSFGTPTVTKRPFSEIGSASDEDLQFACSHFADNRGIQGTPSDCIHCSPNVRVPGPVDVDSRSEYGLKSMNDRNFCKDFVNPNPDVRTDAKGKRIKDDNHPCSTQELGRFEDNNSMESAVTKNGLTLPLNWVGPSNEHIVHEAILKYKSSFNDFNQKGFDSHNHQNNETRQNFALEPKSVEISELIPIQDELQSVVEGSQQSSLEFARTDTISGDGINSKVPRTSMNQEGVGLCPRTKEKGNMENSLEKIPIKSKGRPSLHSNSFQTVPCIAAIFSFQISRIIHKSVEKAWVYLHKYKRGVKTKKKECLEILRDNLPEFEPEYLSPFALSLLIKPMSTNRWRNVQEIYTNFLAKVFSEYIGLEDNVLNETTCLELKRSILWASEIIFNVSDERITSLIQYEKNSISRADEEKRDYRVFLKLSNFLGMSETTSKHKKIYWRKLCIESLFKMLIHDQERGVFERLPNGQISHLWSLGSDGSFWKNWEDFGKYLNIRQRQLVLSKVAPTKKGCLQAWVERWSVIIDHDKTDKYDIHPDIRGVLIKSDSGKNSKVYKLASWLDLKISHVEYHRGKFLDNPGADENSKKLKVNLQKQKNKGSSEEYPDIGRKLIEELNHPVLIENQEGYKFEPDEEVQNEVPPAAAYISIKISEKIIKKVIWIVKCNLQSKKHPKIDSSYRINLLKNIHDELDSKTLCPFVLALLTRDISVDQWDSMIVIYAFFIAESILRRIDQKSTRWNDEMRTRSLSSIIWASESLYHFSNGGFLSFIWNKKPPRGKNKGKKKVNMELNNVFSSLLRIFAFHEEGKSGQLWYLKKITFQKMLEKWENDHQKGYLQEGMKSKLGRLWNFSSKGVVEHWEYLSEKIKISKEKFLKLGIVMPNDKDIQFWISLWNILVNKQDDKQSDLLNEEFINYIKENEFRLQIPSLTSWLYQIIEKDGQDISCEISQEYDFKCLYYGFYFFDPTNMTKKFFFPDVLDEIFLKHGIFDCKKVHEKMKLHRNKNKNLTRSLILDVN